MVRASELEKLLAGPLAGAALAVAGFFKLHRARVFGHLAQGRVIANSEGVPSTDSLSLSRSGESWNNIEWLYDLATWRLYLFGDIEALIIAKCLLLFALGWVLIALAWQASRRSQFALGIGLMLICLAIPGARFGFLMQPDLSGILFCAVLLYGLHRIFDHEPGARSTLGIVVALGVLHLIWVNVHASHLLGLLFTVIYAGFGWGSPAFRPLAALVAIQLVAIVCTPFGFDLSGYAVSEVLSSDYRALVTDWKPWSRRQPVYLLVAPVLQLLLLMVAFIPLKRAGRATAAGAIVGLVLSLLAFGAVRFIPYQLLLTVPFIAVGLCSYVKATLSARVRIVLVIWVAVFGAYAVWMSASLPPRVSQALGIAEAWLPWSSYGFVDRNLDNPRILASRHHSWAALFAINDAKVVVDGRVSFYGTQFTREARRALREVEVFDRLISPSDVDVVITDHVWPAYRPVLKQLVARPEWRLVHIEDQHVVFVRGRDIPALNLLRLGYDPSGVLDPGIDPKQIEKEITRLGTHTNSAVYRVWTQGLLLLRPYARQGAKAGLQYIESPSAQADFALAYAFVGAGHARFPGLAPVELYRALVALGLCGIEQAKNGLRFARHRARELDVKLLETEIMLREGKTQKVEARLNKWMDDPKMKTHPWVLAIKSDLEAGVTCEGRTSPAEPKFETEFEFKFELPSEDD